MYFWIFEWNELRPINTNFVPPSIPQMQTLELVARSRQHGVVNSEVSRIMSIAPRNFHYICKVGRVLFCWAQHILTLLAFLILSTSMIHWGVAYKMPSPPPPRLEPRGAWPCCQNTSHDPEWPSLSPKNNDQPDASEALRPSCEAWPQSILQGENVLVQMCAQHKHLIIKMGRFKVSR